MKLFAGIISADRSTAFVKIHTAAATAHLAESEGEALLRAKAICHERYPASRGYYGHQFGVIEIPKEMIDQAR